MPPPVIECHELGREYHRGDQSVHVLNGLSLTVEQGEFIALMGPSGSGKTTLLNLLGGLDHPSSGTVRVQGLEISRLPEHALAAWRASSVGFIFQFYNLLPVLSALENVQLPLLL